MTNFIKGSRTKSLYFFCLLALLSGKTLEASHLFDHDPIARNQSFEHPKFGITFGINVFPVANFVKDSQERVMHWVPGSNYYRHAVLPQEGIDTYRAYKTLDDLYRENHPDIACKYETLKVEDTPKIPLITHSIWFTNPYQPKELSNEFLEWYRYSCSLHEKDKGWRHILWVQDRTKLPHTTGFLEHHGIEIKEIYKELQEEDFVGMKKYVDHEIKECKFGRAADIFRIVALNKYGGIYRDIDFVFTRPLTGLTLAYDFFAGIEHPYAYICNAIMGFRPGHPILSKYMEIMDRNFQRKGPEYVEGCLTNPEIWDDKRALLHTLCLTGPIAFTVAIKQVLLSQGPVSHGLTIYDQPDGHKDRNIIFPPEVFFNMKDGRSPASFGWHAFATTWLQGGSKG
ncbi:glycosyltransferase family 32 protein [Candidatus Finniella inopinata]|uniref:Mannosyltransferase n=1 Tax=Candidatus Finniella inopinata TaxID=1696036 RepID=A0A4Q7DGK1_9PROT|nr:glycosyltransferase [Candidatus Finniella inopinata]RZI45328.1 hypothetical protein EQU50_07285 [Candidatus Finniella inopinata]